MVAVHEVTGSSPVGDTMFLEIKTSKIMPVLEVFFGRLGTNSLNFVKI